MTLRAFREQCKLFIEKNDFENTFQLFANNLNTDSEYAHLVIAQKGHHKSIFDKDMNGLMSRQDADVEYAKIRRSLLYIIGNMQESDLGAGASLNDPLDKLAEQLPVNSALSPLYLVNCDRKKPVRTFWRSFDALHAEKQRFQFYYILACPSQEPDGFSERMVYELLEKDLESPQVIHYKQKADSGRLQVEPLPQGHNRQGSQNAFKKFFAERFQLTQNENSFEEYLATGLPKLPWQYVATVFKMTAGDWDEDETAAYLQWIMDTFNHTNEGIPTFLFFFVIFIKNAHKDDKIRGEDLEALEGVRTLLAKDDNRSRVALIEALPPVPATDLEYWLDMLCDDVRADDKEAILDALSQRLNPEERELYDKEQCFNMERIKGFQEKVYHYHQHK